MTVTSSPKGKGLPFDGRDGPAGGSMRFATNTHEPGYGRLLLTSAAFIFVFECVACGGIFL